MLEEENSRKRSRKQQEEEPFSWKKEIISWIQIIVAAVIIALVLNNFIIANSRVPTGSMENTIMTGDRILGSRLSYYFGNTPERGDIVIFTHKAEPGKDKTRLVKRVIGLPGETVDIREDKVFINGSDTPLQETYLPEAMDSKDYHFEVPEGCYLMLGDNRNHSIDARGWADPYVTEDEIKEKVLIRYFPHMGRIR